MTNDTTEAEPQVDDDTADDPPSNDETGRKQARAQSASRVDADESDSTTREERERVQPDVDDEPSDGGADEKMDDDGAASTSSEAEETDEQETSSEDETDAESSSATDAADDDEAIIDAQAIFDDETIELFDALQDDVDSLELQDEGVDWLEELFEHMNLDVDIEVLREGERLHFNLQGPDAERLLGFGKLGPKALEGVETVFSRVFADHPAADQIYLDVDGEREARKSMLQNVADDMADKAVDLGKTLTVSGLNSTERRIIHRQLRDYDGVDTESVGSGIFRRLKIEPT